MKILIALFVSTLALSANAFGLDSHYGKLTVANGHHVCTYTNNGPAVYVKRASFELEGPKGSTYTFETQVGKVVASGETVVASASAPLFYKGWYCKFLSTAAHTTATDAPAPY